MSPKKFKTLYIGKLSLFLISIHLIMPFQNIGLIILFYLLKTEFKYLELELVILVYQGRSDIGDDVGLS